ncbi:MAG: hypothetical protein ACKV2V_12480, partial [Blastocatellia bacterium]
KQEFALAAAAAISATLLYAHHNRRGTFFARLLAAGFVAAAIATPAYAWFVWQVGWRTLVIDCHLLFTHLPASLVFYNQRRMGTDAPLFSLLQMSGAVMTSLTLATLIIVIACLITRRSARIAWATEQHDPLRLVQWRAVAALVLSTASALYVMAQTRGHWDGSPLRALPLMLLLLILSSWRRRAGAAELPGGRPVIFIIAMFALTVIARVALRVPGGGAFGGYFLPASMILIVYLLTRSLPRWIEDRTQHQRLATRTRAVARAAIATALLLTIIVFSVRYHRNFPYLVQGPRGVLYTTQAVGAPLQQALDYLARNTAPGEAIAVFPEGADIAFLSGRRMPLRHQIYIPGFLDEAEQQRAIDRLTSQRVRYVLIINRLTREFGKTAFGDDYYQTLGAHIESHYTLAQTFTPRPMDNAAQLQPGDTTFFIKVFSLKNN